ncbi:hypothetical protein [Hymenobacter jeollabukensis]|uniref:Uncharacterized protein n=1 Tax=Hymenobacter jeollabukensis TaxID=2025313 RepID=A0A5R8WIC1_9BACT|nr:hypothetical protein [Hymenobacter jeollabukensis]TLM87953.1 hypothetical protein FDY95_25250 [Hymenobacter jeollabukensis]
MESLQFEKASYLCTPLQKEAVSNESEKRKFFSKVCNRRKASYLCTPLQKEAVSKEKTEKQNQENFFESLRNEKHFLPLQPRTKQRSVSTEKKRLQ